MNKVALITGGSRGLGRNSALALANKGIDVIITYHSQQGAAQEVVEEIRHKGRKATALQLDAGDIDSFRDFVVTLKETLKNAFECDRIDYLINNAGMGIHVSFAETSEDQFDALMNVHLKGAFFFTQTLLPLIQDGGRIINISSGLARFSLPGYCAYAMMKGGIEVMTRYLAKELGGRQIRVNTLAPGAIETDFSGGAVRDNKELNSQIANMTALGRAGLPDDIGNAISMMLSEEAGWITGQRIEASGGMFL
jgi:NAD(P)-dependent dehydrogenase (short-subunit alcohol dehydrogenase family)